MKSKRKNYYVVIKGHNPGFYLKWADCKTQVDKFKGAIFKGFYDFEDAKKWQQQMLGIQERINVLYLNPDDSWDTVPSSNKDEIFINLHWLCNNLELTAKQEETIADLGV